jgi:hypothetical protein
MTADPDPSTIGLWARNVRQLADLREISWASDHFDDWRREKDLYRPISSWHVISVREAPTKDVPAVLVRVVIDGRDLVMLVPDRRPISWAEDPR